MDARATAYLVELTRRVRAVLGDRLTGVWLIGSAALDDYDARRSDLDVLVVARERLPLADRERLAADLDHGALPCPARGLELVLYAREDLADPAGPAFQLNLNTGERLDEHVAYDARADPRFWFTVDVAIARQRGVPLVGPPTAEVLPQLPRDLVASALEEALDWYAGEGGSPVQTLLSACRTWAWATDGEWRSKSEAAAWATERLADPGPVLRALRLRDGGQGLPPTEAEVNAVLAAARGALGAR